VLVLKYNSLAQLRTQMGFCRQADLAQAFELPLKTLRNWEQSDTPLDKTAGLFMRVIAIYGAEAATTHAQSSMFRASSVANNEEVKNLRDQFHLTQNEFCHRFGFQLKTYQKWEQDTTEPPPAAKALLRIIGARPDMLDKALQSRLFIEPRQTTQITPRV